MGTERIRVQDTTNLKEDKILVLLYLDNVMVKRMTSRFLDRNQRDDTQEKTLLRCRLY